MKDLSVVWTKDEVCVVEWDHLALEDYSDEWQRTASAHRWPDRSVAYRFFCRSLLEPSERMGEAAVLEESRWNSYCNWHLIKEHSESLGESIFTHQGALATTFVSSSHRSVDRQDVSVLWAHRTVEGAAWKNKLAKDLKNYRFFQAPVRSQVTGVSIGELDIWQGSSETMSVISLELYVAKDRLFDLLLQLLLDSLSIDQLISQVPLKLLHLKKRFLCVPVTFSFQAKFHFEIFAQLGQFHLVRGDELS